jgi:hypothetical protein
VIASGKWEIQEVVVVSLGTGFVARKDLFAIDVDPHTVVGADQQHIGTGLFHMKGCSGIGDAVVAMSRLRGVDIEGSVLGEREAPMGAVFRMADRGSEAGRQFGLVDAFWGGCESVGSGAKG